MNHQKSKRHTPAKSVILFAWITLTLVLSLVLAWDVLAQSENGSWLDPINLSRSSGASEPVSVADESGRTHVIWKDISGSYYYSREVAGEWSEPMAIDPPFGTRRYDPNLTETKATPLYTPILISDSKNGIHAVWIDGSKALSYSFVESNDFSEAEAWTTPQQITGPALDMAIAIDDDERIHVVYLRTAESSDLPAGLYYSQSEDGGLTWSGPDLLYESSYLRVLSSSDANVEIVAAGPDTIIVAWDNRPLERVFYVSSRDGGSSWEPVREVDRRLETDGAETAGPQDIRIGLRDSEIHLVWLAGHERSECILYYQLSRDLGQNWEPLRRIPDVFSGCPKPLQFLSTPDETLLFTVESEDELYVTGWDGIQWVDPIEQSRLSTIVNPETYRPIQNSCHESIVTNNSGSRREPLVLTIACEAGNRGDIWASTIEASQLIEQVMPSDPPEWQNVGEISQGGNLQSPILFSDGDGFLHAIWSQKNTSDQTQRRIRYGRWNGLGWSPAQTILGSPDGSDVAGVSALIDASGNLLVTWSGGLPGDIYFSRNTVARAISPEDWGQPVAIPVPRPAAASPDIAVNSTGTIMIAYALPLNENRGVYLTKSDDGGDVWQETNQVIDAAELDWEKVDSPKLVITPDDTLHMIWQRFSLPPTSKPISLHYARSEDGGENWSEPFTVSESPAIWTKLLAVDEQSIHVIWQTESNDLWHLLSIDKGTTWNQPQRIEGFLRTDGHVAATLDGANQPQLIQINNQLSDDEDQRFTNPELRHWTWSGQQWFIQDSTALDIQKAGDLDIAVTSKGRLGLILLAERENLIGEPPTIGLNFTSRNLDLPAIQATLLPTPFPTSLPEATPTVTPLPQPTATIEFPTNQDAGQQFPLPVDASNPLTGSLFGVLAAGILTVVVFFFGVRILRGDRRRR